jgi:hypothetical protein
MRMFSGSNQRIGTAAKRIDAAIGMIAGIYRIVLVPRKVIGSPCDDRFTLIASSRAQTFRKR